MTSPTRPLGPIGTALWDEAAGAGLEPTEELLIVCETADERTALRQRVLRDPTPEDRKALRELDEAVRHGRFVLGLTGSGGPIVGQLQAAVDELELVVRRRPLAAIARALAVGLEEATARGDPHGQAAVARELRSVYHELAGPLTDDPFDDFLTRLSTPLGDAAST